MNQNRKWIPLALVCAMLVAMAGGGLLMLLGLKDTEVTFAPQTGDAEAWQGVTLTGIAGDTSYRQEFTLQDGRVKNELNLNVPKGTQESAYLDFFWTIPPEEHDKADASATATIDGEYTRYETVTRRAVCMAIIHLPEGEVRLNTGFSAELETEIFWSALVREDKAYLVDYLQDGGESGTLLSEKLPQLQSCVQMGESQYFYLPAFETQEAAIYRVDRALSAKELAALEPTGTVHGEPLRLTSTEYGEVTKLATLGKGTELLSLCGTENALCAITQRGEERRLLTILPDGTVGDALDLVLPEAFGDNQCGFYENRESNEVAFVIQTSPGDSANGFCLYGAYRIRDGKFAEGKTVTLPFDPNVGVPRQILLDAEGSRLVVVQQQMNSAKVEYFDQAFEQSYTDGLLLSVYAQSGKAPVATGLLRCNEPMDSARESLPMNYGTNRWMQFARWRSMALSSGGRNQNSFKFFRF